jgi:hypothetical protein
VPPVGYHENEIEVQYNRRGPKNIEPPPEFGLFGVQGLAIPELNQHRGRIDGDGRCADSVFGGLRIAQQNEYGQYQQKHKRNQRYERKRIHQNIFNNRALIVRQDKTTFFIIKTNNRNSGHISSNQLHLDVFSFPVITRHYAIYRLLKTAGRKVSLQNPRTDATPHADGNTAKKSGIEGASGL